MGLTGSAVSSMLTLMLLENESAENYLKEEFQKRVDRNARYSLRAFARQLGMSPGELSEVMRGKRGLSLKSSLKIAESIGLNATETRHLVFLAQKDRSERNSFPGEKLSKKNLHEPTRLSLDLFKLLSDWYCFAILNLAETVDFNSSPRWIAKKLGLTVSQTITAVERLERVGLVEKSGKNWTPTKDYVLSPEGIPSEAIRNYHKQILSKAIEALDCVSVEKREISGVGIAISAEDIGKFKKDIGNFIDEMAEKYSKGTNRSEVYHLGVSFFPLTSGGRK